MIPTKFKQPQEINIKNKLLEYFTKLAIKDADLMIFADQLQQSRTVISNLKITYENLEKVETLRSVLTAYISDLNALKSKISFWKF